MSKMKEYFIVAKTDGTMLVEEYERKANGSLSDFYNKYIDGHITVFNSRLEVQTADEGNVDVLVMFGYELTLENSILNLIGCLLYSDYILGDIIIGRLGFYKGEPDMVGFETAEQANELAIILQTFYNKSIKDMGLEHKREEFLEYLENKGYFVRYNYD